MFTRLDGRLLASATPGRQVQIIVDHIQRQAETTPFRPDLERLKALPIEVQTIYWVRLFLELAEGGGIIEFLLGQSGIYTPEMHAALRRCDVDEELLARIEAGIETSLRDDHPEFARHSNRRWFEQFPRSQRYQTQRAVDQGSRPLFAQLHEKLAAYIERHRDVVITD